MGQIIKYQQEAFNGQMVNGSPDYDILYPKTSADQVEGLDKYIEGNSGLKTLTFNNLDILEETVSLDMDDTVNMDNFVSAFAYYFDKEKGVLSIVNEGVRFLVVGNVLNVSSSKWGVNKVKVVYEYIIQS